jgi:hypothetical protein
MDHMTGNLKGGGGGRGGEALEGKTQKEVRRLTQCTIYVSARSKRNSTEW